MTSSAATCIFTPSKGESDEFHCLVMEAASKADQVCTLLESLNDKISPLDGHRDIEDIITENGLGFLDLKNVTMLEYLSDLTLILLRKSHGKKIQGEIAIERIVENRTVLEKMRPIEKKLKYQIEKYVKIAESGGEINSEDPVQFKPNPAALAADYDSEDTSDADDLQDDVKEDKGSNQKYVVPKHIPTLCEDDISSRQDLDKEDRAVLKKKTLSKSILEDLRRQHLDTPEEEYHQTDTFKARHVAMLKERARFEEENFMRLPAMSKKEKHKLKKRSMTTMGNLADEITYFGQNNFYNKKPEGGKEKRKSGAGIGGKSFAKKRFKRK